MKRIINAIVFSVFIFVSFFSSMYVVKANTIHSIDMDIYIDDKGNANVVEIWEATLNQGTEGFRPYTDLEYSNISNFRVIDETGREYERQSNWDTSASFNTKAYKSGINHIYNGVELCWGISEYGKKTYTLKYDISNFVYQYTDTQGIYFNMLNLDQSVKKAKIKIHSDIPFSLDNSRIWSFGNDGTINFNNGVIELDSDGSLSSSEYMVALVRFEYNIFNIDISTNKSFDDDYDSAMADIEEDNKSGLSFKDILTLLISVCISIIINPVFIMFVIISIIKIFQGKGKIFVSKEVDSTLDFGIYGTNLPWDDEINYWREVPCNKDIFRAYWVSYQYNVEPISTLHEGLIGAILLKWIKEGNITVIKDKEWLVNFKDNNYKIDLSRMKYTSNNIENKLFDILKKAAGPNNILESKELVNWCERNYGKLENWFYLVIKEEQKELEKQGLITEVTEILGSKKIISKKVSNELREDAIKLKGLKKFLLAFSIMPEREYFEVHMWEEYLIFAELLGIADKVAEQFSKLYPDFVEASNYNLATTVVIRNIASSSRLGIERGRERTRIISESVSKQTRDYSGRSRSSGGGGRSYRGGGSSSRGSRGGGFR